MIQAQRRGGRKGRRARARKLSGLKRKQIARRTARARWKSQDPSSIAEAGGPVKLRIGPDGDLYSVDFDAGSIRRIQYVGGNLPPTASNQATPTSGPTPLTVAFHGTGSSDPDAGDMITAYAWDLDGDGQYDDSTPPQTTFVYVTPGTYTARLRVTDSRDATGTASVVITAGNTPPTAVIDTLQPTTTWQVGDLIAFSGHATDPQDGSLPPSALSWSVILHHCSSPTNCHIHPLRSFQGSSGGSFPAPDHEYPSYLELSLVATGSGSLQDAKSILLYPKTVDLSLQSISGLQLTVDSSVQTTPFSRTGVLSVRRHEPRLQRPAQAALRQAPRGRDRDPGSPPRAGRRSSVVS